MSILGAVLRTHPAQLEPVLTRLKSLPGVDISLNPGDGRLVLVLEDTLDAAGQPVSAAATLADMAMWPDVLSTSLVYEYSGPDAPAIAQRDMSDYSLWRSRPGAAPQENLPTLSDISSSDKLSTISTLPNLPTTAQLANQVPVSTEREQTP